MSQRTKLEKLAHWRIDPSLIELTGDAPEFRGGFATVSKGLLASPSPAKGVTNGSKQITDEHPGSDAGNSKSERDTRQPGDDHQGKDEGADGHAAGDENDIGHTGWQGRKESGEEQKPTHQSPIPEIGYGLTSSEQATVESPDPGNRDTQSESDTQKPKDDQQSGDTGLDGHKAPDGGNGQTKGKREKIPRTPTRTRIVITLLLTRRSEMSQPLGSRG